MNDFKQRLIEEQAELEEKLNKLNDFNQSEKVDGIEPPQKSLLLVQAGAMYTYNECLKARLQLLQNPLITPPTFGRGQTKDMSHGIHKYKGADFPTFHGKDIEVRDNNEDPSNPCYDIRFVGQYLWLGMFYDDDIDWQ